MSDELTDTITSISRSANTLIASDVWTCLFPDPENPAPAQGRVEDDCVELKQAAARLPGIFSADPSLAGLQSILPALNSGVVDLSEGMRILARYWQMSAAQIERAAELVRIGYGAIDKALRTIVQMANVPVDIFTPRRDRIHAMHANLLASLAERFTERLATTAPR